MKFDPNRHPAYVILFAAGISGLFTAAIMALHVATKPIVEANERLLTEKAIVDVFNLGDTENLSAEQVAGLIRRRVAGLPSPDRPNDPRARELFIVDAATGERVRILIAYSADIPADREVDITDRTNVIGYAFGVRGVGFWAMIEGWLAVDPTGDRALGVVFTTHQETPGLGGRITEKAFREQFRGLDVAKPVGDEKFVSISHQRPDPSSPRYSSHVDALSGATGTSSALDVFLNEDIARFRRVAKAAGLIATEADTTPGG